MKTLEFEDQIHLSVEVMYWRWKNGWHNAHGHNTKNMKKKKIQEVDKKTDVVLTCVFLYLVRICH